MAPVADDCLGSAFEWLRPVTRKLRFFAADPILVQCRWLVTPARAKCRSYSWPGTLVHILPPAEYLA